jgi:hypothetical protein
VAPLHGQLRRWTVSGKASAPSYDGDANVDVPRVKMPKQQQSSTQETVDSGAAAPGAVDAQKVDGEKELPGRLKRRGIGSPAVLAAISEPLQESREIEATLRKLIEPSAAAIEGADTAEVEPAAAAIEESNTAEVGPDVGTRRLQRRGIGSPAVLAAISEPRQPRPKVPNEQVVGPVPVESPAEKRRFGSVALAAALVALLIGALFFVASRDGSVTAPSVPTVTAAATLTVSKPTSEPSTDTGEEEPTIQLGSLRDSARPFETVRIQGSYRGGANTFLRIQREEEDRWVDFPLPTKTDEAGHFTSHVEFGRPGRYRLRVLDPDAGVTSKSFVLLIKG